MQNFQQCLFKIQNTIKKSTVRLYALADHLGYKGDRNVQGAIMRNILNGKQEFLVRHLNGIAQFLRYPVGYFLIHEHSTLLQIDEEKIQKKINALFEEKKIQDKKEKKRERTYPKYKLGEKLGKGENKISQIATVNMTIRGERALRAEDLFYISDFFGISLEELIKE